MQNAKVSDVLLGAGFHPSKSFKNLIRIFSKSINENHKNPSADVFSSVSFCADVIVLCLRASSRTNLRHHHFVATQPKTSS